MIRQWAQHYFDRDMNAWAVGYYDSAHYSPNAKDFHKSEESAKRAAEAYNATQPKEG